VFCASRAGPASSRDQPTLTRVRGCVCVGGVVAGGVWHGLDGGVYHVDKGLHSLWVSRIGEPSDQLVQLAVPPYSGSLEDRTAATCRLPLALDPVGLPTRTSQ
jgi:hypothetical protein